MSTKHPAKEARCSSKQVEAFEAIATNMDPSAHHRTIKALLDKGMIECVGKKRVGRDAFGSIDIPIYAVPRNVHLQWCRWCDENVSDAEDY
jgi:hypothetical protein